MFIFREKSGFAVGHRDQRERSPQKVGQRVNLGSLETHSCPAFVLGQIPHCASVVSDSVQPHRRQPNCPRDSPGKNTGVGCHFLLQCMKVKSESEVAQSYPTLSDPMDCSPPGSSVHGIFQARSCVWNPRVFADDARGWQCPFVLCLHLGCAFF